MKTVFENINKLKEVIHLNKH